MLRFLTAWGTRLLVGTYAWKLRVTFAEGQETVGDQVVLEAPAERREEDTRASRQSKSPHVAEVEHLPRSRTASSNFFSSMAFCTSWV